MSKQKSKTTAGVDLFEIHYGSSNEYYLENFLHTFCTALYTIKHSLMGFQCLDIVKQTCSNTRKNFLFFMHCHNLLVLHGSGICISIVTINSEITIDTSNIEHIKLI